MSFAELQPPTPANQKLAANVCPSNWTNPQPKDRYHLVVIGAGTAGLVAAAGAAGLGARVALIERRLMGGDCLNTGCVPSKGLLAAGRAAAALQKAASFGVGLSSQSSIDFAAAMQRMRGHRAQISANDSAQRFTDLGVDVYFGQASFNSSTQIAVTGEYGERQLNFRKAVIATGARAAKPPIPGLDAVEYLTNENVFSLTELPQQFAVIGGGPIGCELAQAFARLGSQVTLFTDSAGLLPREDPQAAAIVSKSLTNDGVTLLAGGRELSVKPQEDKGILVSGPHGTLQADQLLVATGRQPNVEGLNLSSARVQFDPRSGIQVDDRLGTTAPNIYAAGDVCSEAKFTHAADFQARTVVRNALMPWPLNRSKASKLIIPWCTYTSPEVAGVGLTEKIAEERGIAVDAYQLDLKEIDRAILDGSTEGFAKVLTAAGTDRVIGATLVAPNAGDLIGEISLAMTCGIGLGKVATAIHPYPTIGEVFRKIGDQYNRTRLTPTAKRVFDTWFKMTR